MFNRDIMIFEKHFIGQTIFDQFYVLNILKKRKRCTVCRKLNICDVLKPKIGRQCYQSWWSKIQKAREKNVIKPHAL